MNKIIIHTIKNSLALLILSLFIGQCANGCGIRQTSEIPPGYDTIAPSVPGSFSATTAGANQINLSWLASTDNLVSPANAISYEICQGTTSGSCTVTYTVTPGNTSYSVTGLLASTNYFFSIRAIDSSGNKSAYSPEVSVTTNAGGAIGVTINQAAIQTDPANTFPVSFTIVFSSAIDPLTFTTADIIQTGSATGVVWSAPTTADNITWTLQATAVATNGTIIPTIAATSVTDLAANTNTASTSTDNSVTIDTIAPTVTINQATLQPDPINLLPISFTVVFSEPIAPLTFTSADITQTGTATGVVWAAPTTSDNITWTVLATSATTDGTIIPTIAAASVTDLAGNNNTVSTSTDNSVTIDTIPPTVSTGLPSVSLVNSLGTVNYTVTYVGADIINLLPANITLNTTGTATCMIGVTAGTTSTPTVTLNNCTGNGTVGITVAAATASDFAGNANSASAPSTTFTVDGTAPAGYLVAIDQAAINSTNQAAISFTFTAAEIAATYNYTISSSGGGVNVTGTGTIV
ncbi:MAG: fibronectin type III domain-containing protein, partial [Spirochaetia bacterium]|nr:fibronectin type III domain-containing protein [Spirochaetia bacterium]